MRRAGAEGDADIGCALGSFARPSDLHYIAGWASGILHVALVVTWSVLLANAVLIRFRKLPFTCAFPLFQQHSIVTLLGCVLAFTLFAIVTPHFEHFALA